MLWFKLPDAILCTVRKPIALLIVAGLVWGCGGNGGSTRPESVPTRLKVKIAWPDDITRDVNAPASAASASIRFRVAGTDDIVTSAKADRAQSGPYTQEYTSEGFGATQTRYELVVLFFGVPRGYDGDSNGETVAVVRQEVRIQQDGTIVDLDGAPLEPIAPVSTIERVVATPMAFPLGEAMSVRSAISAFARSGAQLALPASVGDLVVLTGPAIVKTPAGFVSQGYGRSRVKAVVDGVESVEADVLTERPLVLSP